MKLDHRGRPLDVPVTTRRARALGRCPPRVERPAYCSVFRSLLETDPATRTVRTADSESASRQGQRLSVLHLCGCCFPFLDYSDVLTFGFSRKGRLDKTGSGRLVHSRPPHHIAANSTGLHPARVVFWNSTHRQSHRKAAGMRCAAGARRRKACSCGGRWRGTGRRRR